MSTDTDEENPANRWKRGFAQFGGASMLIGPPEEIEPLLDLIQPQLLPDSMHRRFVLNLQVENQRFTVDISERIYQNPEVWRMALSYLVECKKAYEEAKGEWYENKRTVNLPPIVRSCFRK